MIIPLAIALGLMLALMFFLKATSLIALLAASLVASACLALVWRLNSQATLLLLMVRVLLFTSILWAHVGGYFAKF